MTFERFTDRSRKVCQLANQEAGRWGHEYLGTEHLLLGLLKEGSGNACRLLVKQVASLHAIGLSVEKLLVAEPNAKVAGKLPHTPAMKRVVEHALDEARLLTHNYVGTEHLLLGMLRDEKGVAGQVLRQHQVTLEGVRQAVKGELETAAAPTGESEVLFGELRLKKPLGPAGTTIVDTNASNIELIVHATRNESLHIDVALAHTIIPSHGMAYRHDLLAINLTLDELKQLAMFAAVLVHRIEHNQPLKEGEQETLLATWTTLADQQVASEKQGEVAK